MKFDKISVTKCSYKDNKEKLLGLPGSDGPNTPNRYKKYVSNFSIKGTG